MNTLANDTNFTDTKKDAEASLSSEVARQKSGQDSVSLNILDDTNYDKAHALRNEGKHRKRRRHIYNKICEQMEFYFGDVNLSKDRFLMQQIKKDPSIPLTLFLKFNKIRELTNCIEDIVKAVENSDMLELDPIKLTVRRTTAINIRNADHKTIYVEAIPKNANHDWLRNVFKRFGPVAYVSLPRYYISRRIKEFGFVEFDHEESVLKAIKAFETFNGVLSSEINPLKLYSARVIELTHGPMQLPNNKNVSFMNDITEKKIKNLNKNDKDNAKNNAVEQKQKLTHKNEAIDDSEYAPQKKRIKIENDDEENSVDKNKGQDTQVAEDRMVKINRNIKIVQTETFKNGNVKTTDSKTANAERNEDKKRRKKKKKKNKTKNDLFEIDPNCLELKILPKKDWLRLRDIYMEMRKTGLSQLKRITNPKGNDCHKPDYNGQDYENLTVHGDTSIIASEPPIKRLKVDNGTATGSLAAVNASGNVSTGLGVGAPAEATSNGTAGGVHKMSMNIYDAGGGETEVETNKNIPFLCEPRLNYIPGVIVEITVADICIDKVEFKTNVRQYDNVKYVDFKDGARSAYVRFGSAATAKDFLLKFHCAEYKCKILQDLEELDYWKQIEIDRYNKSKKIIKVNKVRGREKVQKLVAKHARFTDEDAEVISICGGTSDAGNIENIENSEHNKIHGDDRKENLDNVNSESTADVKLIND